jgi:RNA polymerase sigma factor for flagellar operon FliA
MHRAHALYVAPEKTDDNELVRRHSALLDRLARQVAARLGAEDCTGDLWTAGALGLLEAARRFDGNRAVGFEAFAQKRVRGAMLDELRRLDHLPRRLRARAAAVAKARRQLAKDLGRESTLEEAATKAGMDPSELAEVEAAALAPLPLDPELLANLEEHPDDRLDRARLHKALVDAVANLPERLRILMGLYHVEGLTYREIAKVLGLSEPRVCQLHSEAVEKLRQALSAFAPAA